MSCDISTQSRKSARVTICAQVSGHSFLQSERRVFSVEPYNYGAAFCALFSWREAMRQTLIISPNRQDTTDGGRYGQSHGFFLAVA